MENNNVILVIDDDRNILSIIEMYLKKAGFSVASPVVITNTPNFLDVVEDGFLVSDCKDHIVRVLDGRGQVVGAGQPRRHRARRRGCAR